MCDILELHVEEQWRVVLYRSLFPRRGNVIQANARRNMRLSIDSFVRISFGIINESHKNEPLINSGKKKKIIVDKNYYKKYEKFSITKIYKISFIRNSNSNIS